MSWSVRGGSSIIVALLAGAAFFGTPGFEPRANAQSQVQTVQRAAKGQAGKDIQIGIYLNVQPDCTSGQLPTIRLRTAPAHGRVVVRKAKVNATNYKQCLALEVPGYVAFYRSAPDFSGNDVISLEVSYVAGRTEIQEITVTVVDAAGKKNI